MISRDLTLTITDTNVSLDKNIILYRYDRGITLNITLKSDTYDLVDEITKARAIILRPNKKLSATPITDITDGVYVLYLDDTWTDHLGEVGTYQIQLQLYSDNPNDECITIAPTLGQTGRLTVTKIISATVWMTNAISSKPFRTSGMMA